MTIRPSVSACLVLGATAITSLVAGAHEDKHGHGHSSATSREHRAPAAVRITMEELHTHGGVPPGWRLTVPPGDPKSGREVFAKLECFKCHAIKGEHFPHTAQEPGNAGPDLTGMGSHHPPAYFLESILNPNAVIVTGPGYTSPDGLSIMPDYRDSVTAAELIDVVAYLGSLTDGVGHRHTTVNTERERVAGAYRVRVDYHAAHASHDHGKPAHGQPAERAHGHLMVFVTDTKTGEPVPYLPVSVALHGAKRAPTIVKLAPMVGTRGFHYFDTDRIETLRRFCVEQGALMIPHHLAYPRGRRGVN